MEPMELGLGLAGHVGKALFHVALHVAGHETFHHLKHKFTDRWLRNHDVSRLLNESYIAALELLERDLKGRLDGAEEKKASADAFKRLRGQAPRLFPVETGDAALTELQAAELASDAAGGAALVPDLLERAEPVPAPVRALLLNSFPGAFAYAFRELGLKRNDKVRTVVVHELLTDLRRSGAVADSKLDDVRARLEQLPDLMGKQDELLRFQRRFQASIEGALGTISDQLGTVAARQEELIGLVRQAVAPEAPAKAFAMVRDGEGNVMGRYPLAGPLVSIGRDRENTVQLAHKSVSGRHAEIKIENGFFLLRDLGSVNGTFLGEDSARVGRKLVAIGQKIRVGPFTIELQPPDAASEPFVGGTVPV